MPLKTWRRLFLILWAAVTLVWIILLFKSLDPFGASRVIYDFKVGPKTWLSGEITSVKSDGIAERAGLRVGDVLPQSTLNRQDAWSYPDNKPLVLDVIRDGSPVQVVINPERKPREFKNQVLKLLGYVETFLCLICSFTIALFGKRNDSFRWLSFSFLLYAAGNWRDIPAIGSEVLPQITYLVFHQLAFLFFIKFWVKLYADCKIDVSRFWSIFQKWFLYFIIGYCTILEILLNVITSFLPDNFESHIAVLDNSVLHKQFMELGFYMNQAFAFIALVACVWLPLRLLKLVSKASSNQIYWTAATLVGFYFSYAISVFIYTVGEGLRLALSIHLEWIRELHNFLGDLLSPLAPLSVLAFIYVSLSKRLISFSYFVNKAFVYGLMALLLLGGYSLFSNQLDAVAQNESDFAKIGLFTGVVVLSFLATYMQDFTEVAIRRFLFVDVDRREDQLRAFVEAMGKELSLDFKSRFCAAVEGFCHGASVVLFELRDGVWIDGVTGKAATDTQAVVERLNTKAITLEAADLPEASGLRLVVPGFHRGAMSCFLCVAESADLPAFRPDEIRMLEGAVQRYVLELKNRELEHAHNQIISSVDYAARIQRAHLPETQQQREGFEAIKVWWEPRDRIGGDIWWMSPIQDDGSYAVVLADCTGHGVPGAMLSVTVVNLLDQIARDYPQAGPSGLLEALDERLRLALNQQAELGDSDDGCDAVAIRVVPRAGSVLFAGAKLGVIYKDGHSIERIAGDNLSLGYRRREIPETGIKQHERSMTKGAVFILYSDGLTDQIGGTSERGISFGHRRIAQAVRPDASAGAVVDAIRRDFLNWQGIRPRRDDVSVLVLEPRST